MGGKANRIYKLEKLTVRGRSKNKLLKTTKEKVTHIPTSTVITGDNQLDCILFTFIVTYYFKNLLFKLKL